MYSIVLIVAVLFWIVSVYNRLVGLSNRAIEGWAGIDVQLQRRYNLIPGLVEVVRGYQKYEEQVLQQITALRSAAVRATQVADRCVAESELAAGLERLLVVVEKYPELKADQAFRKLHQSLVEVEDALQLSRRYYNGTVRDYNIKVQSFPSMIIALLGRFKERSYFEITQPSERNVPQVVLEERQ